MTRRLVLINGKYFYARPERSVKAQGSFSVWLSIYANAVDFDSLSIYEKDKLFRKYQIECAKLDLEWESPALYGVRGLFG